MSKKNDELNDLDWDAPLPPPDDIHLRANSKPTQVAPIPEAPVVRPPRVKTSIKEMTAIAADPTTPAGVRQLALDVVKIYGEGRLRAVEECPTANENYKHMNGHLVLMMSGRGDIAALNFQD